jgi:hypothetical protein
VSEQKALAPELLGDPLPEIPEQNAKGWELIQASKLGDRMKRALRRVATGSTFTNALAALSHRRWTRGSSTPRRRRRLPA